MMGLSSPTALRLRCDIHSSQPAGLCHVAGPCLSEAKEILGQWLQMRDSCPLGFALLCDELASAVTGNQLAQPLEDWLQQRLRPMLSDLALGGSLPDVQVCLIASA